MGFQFGNNEQFYVNGKGSIILNDKIKCHNVYWIDGIKYSFLSVAQLINFGYRVEFLNKKEKVYDAMGELIGIGEKTRGNLFYLDLSEDTCLFS